MALNIFVSWSGSASQGVASLLRDWLPYVLQGAKLFVSTHDINKGTKWTAALWDVLSTYDCAIVVVTKENLNAPWILFEAGALSKTLSSRTIPLLCDISRGEMSGSPLSHLQNATAEKDDLAGLVHSLNASQSDPIEHNRLTAAFEKWWPDFDSEFKKIKFQAHQHDSQTKASDGDRFAKIEQSLELILKFMNSASRGGANTISAKDIIVSSQLPVFVTDTAADTPTSKISASRILSGTLTAADVIRAANTVLANSPPELQNEGNKKKK